jgi:GT2 family glycosyltransferase
LARDLLQYGPEDIKIFIWDNNPEPPIEFDDDPKVEVILDNTNSGYIVPNNRMATACNSKYHIVSNDDVEVGPNWFESFVKEFDNARMACVGPKGQYGRLDASFDGQPVMPGESPEYIEGWWMVFPRHIIDRYGWVFDEENLRYATSEDSHTCLLLQEHGWEIKILKNLPIKHLESRTKKSLKMRSWCDENKHWLKIRWADYLKTREFPQHKILIKDTSRIKEVRWKYPHSHLVLLLEDGLVDEIVNDSKGNYSMEI